MAPMAMFH
uniref:Uncharacterized protein n=1 Tax=Oryza glumipatula TaxID=40148 RepID=A0A0G2KBN4_9ORYZ